MLYLSGIILAFFLSFLLITKRNKSTADNILTIWLVFFGFHLFCYYLLFTNQQFNYPTLVGLGLSLPLIHGPFLYLYTRQQISNVPFSKKQFLHFLPLLLSYFMFFRFYFLPFDQKVAVFQHNGQGFKIESLINLYAIYVSGIVYVSLSLIKLLKYRKNIVHQFSNTDKINFNWLLYLILWMVVIWVVILFIQKDSYIFGAASLFVLWLGYFGIKQVQVFSQSTSLSDPETYLNLNQKFIKNKIQESENDINPGTKSLSDNSEGSKYLKSSLSDHQVNQIHDRLIELMKNEKPFKNPDLTLNELAKSLDVHPNSISQVINSKEKKNFYELINEKRVEEFLNRISQSSSQQYTLLAIAYDCGFNSKASFNRNFKKYTGLPPRDYLKQQLIIE